MQDERFEDGPKVNRDLAAWAQGLALANKRNSGKLAALGRACQAGFAARRGFAGGNRCVDLAGVARRAANLLGRRSVAIRQKGNASG